MSYSEATGFRAVRLLGSDHTKLGEIASAELGQGIAIALSRGRYPKGYRHLDKNEDAVLAASNGTVSLVAVADGHAGFDAARAAIEALDESIPLLLDIGAEDPEAALRRGFQLAREAVAPALAEVSGPRRSSRAALVVCIADAGRAAVANLGDAVAIRMSGKKVSSLLGVSSPYLNASVALDDLEVRLLRLNRGDRVALMSDGVPDFLGGDWLRRLRRLAGGSR